MRIWSSIFLMAWGFAGAAVLPPMKVLFWGGQSGIHNTWEQGNRFVTEMKKVGIEVTYAGETDNAQINDGNLAKYDAILAFHQSWEPKITTAQVDALYRFVESGKGIVFTHMSLVASAVTDAETERYTQLIGGYMNGHGYTYPSGDPILLDSSDYNHPALKGTPIWTTWDETYMAGVRAGTTVIQHRAKQDVAASPWTWVRNQGKGRVYYTAWGHDHYAWSKWEFMKQLEIALIYVTAGARTPTSLNRTFIYPEAAGMVSDRNDSRSGFEFVWASDNRLFSLDGKVTRKSQLAADKK